MNKHLNIYKPFNLNQNQEYIENNLSRALVLCLQNDQWLLERFISEVLEEQDYDQSFQLFNSDDSLSIDIQVSINDLSQSEFDTVYAVSLTEELCFLESFHERTAGNKSQSQVTDIIVQINGSILIIVEVKTDKSKCEQQLYNQINQLFQSEVELIREKVKTKALSWSDITKSTNHYFNLTRGAGYRSPFVKDFLKLVQLHKTHWLPIKPLSVLTNNAVNDKARLMRLEAALQSCESENIELLNYNDRKGLNLNLSWASELLFWFERDPNNNINLVISMWPGNTKSQGWTLYKPKNMKWSEKESIEIAGINYPLKKHSHIKFTSFQRFFASIDFSEEQVQGGTVICNQQNFKKYSGRKKRESWNDLESFFNSSFVSSFDWKAQCHWKDKMLYSGKSQFDVSFGFRCYIQVPYQDLQGIDLTTDNGTGFNRFVLDAFKAFNSINE
ncbi:hypothetical protein Oweho_3562 [Owenweeksia hongkongensis DSM 17368]|uniref:Uncharacterized protein n=1 Tax=Owenweeksia hongkongensis (strain DSM 17368 / CIP 108786 / JCM 12287 / NRRL B-23963 / UST20020801) TaxID=926562 RepID=G8R7A3_OWEHD|nr:hypothetical protein [Owenweeksia hongkongensis]AEV34510.1 hypothetical protein Oweho_3562 [Owenweeksia hongkongensis DSM 17368]